MANSDLNSQEITETPDEAAIKTLIESVATLADMHNFKSLERLYAEEVNLDYSSLFGAAPELKKASALMKEWSGVLPGFDRTRHALSNIQVSLENDAFARATAEVVAKHWLGSSFWQVCGSYNYELKKQDSKWRITMHRFNLQKEIGSRDIINAAIAQVSKI